MGERGRVSLSVWNGYELDKGLTHLTVYRQCSFSFAHSCLLAGHDTLGPTSPSFDTYTTIACFICICSHHHNVFRFISFPFIRFYMNCFDFICVFVILCTGLLFLYIHLHSIPFHFLFIVLFCLPFWLFFLFCFVSFSLHYLLFWLCHFWYVCYAVCSTCIRSLCPLDMHCTHPLQKSVESVCASDNHAKPFNNNIKYSLIRFALSRCTHGASTEELFLINLC